MVKKFSFKKLGGEPSYCWYCGKETTCVLLDLRTKEEIWCCPSCALKHAKIKRLRNNPLKQKSLKISNINKGKNEKQASLMEGVK